MMLLWVVAKKGVHGDRLSRIFDGQP
jgi:hypothetical protein